MGIAAARRYVERGYVTIVEGILLPGWFLEPLRDSLRSAGHDVALAVLSAPLDICMSRAASREAARPPEVAGLLDRKLADGDLAV